ncbi:helix-turn-helix transcriptional regulator [Cytobacillus spongiae]|uniref:helix-turn-helix transcriptional regulator n=1 Tax=Cytobacillus spongiae TaxID=2901381 RepID=UPI001F242AE6|nr:helix-turn-helix transcriptional regulator [Cytobacillus spongiae]UII56578.1 helix-turn-helix transcriptional regulator [Cytobacillus spongiae]
MHKVTSRYWKHVSDTLQKKHKDSYQYRKDLIHKLREVIEFDAYCCTVINPDTLTSVGAVTESSLEDIHHKLLTCEYLGNDVHLYEDLIVCTSKVGRLSDTFGKVKSRRYETILKPLHFSDEVRVALMDRSKCYGFLTLFRKKNQPYFSDEAVQLLENLSAIAGQALRAYYHSLLDQTEDRRMIESGVIILTNKLQIQSMNDLGLQCLNQLWQLEGSDSQETLPIPLQAICTKLLVKGENSSPFFIPITENMLITASATFLYTDQSKDHTIAITLNRATSKDMLFYLMEAYQLTFREQQVVLECLKGSLSKEIAHQLNISYYTVQDHFKVIFQKIGVSSRNELVWKLYSKYH